MIKASGTTKDGGKLVILGLSAANVQRLMAGQPIPVDLQELIGEHSPRIHVVLIGGETEQAMQSDMARHFSIGETRTEGEQ